jgi:hypothetical protein
VPAVFAVTEKVRAPDVRAPLAGVTDAFASVDVSATVGVADVWLRYSSTA